MCLQSAHISKVISKSALESLVLSSLALRRLSWGPARAQSAFPLNIAHSRVCRALEELSIRAANPSKCRSINQASKQLFSSSQVCSSVSTGRDVPLSLCPGTKKFSCPGVPLSREKGRSKNPGTNSSVPGQNHFPKRT
jgi:hypothetical protein